MAESKQLALIPSQGMSSSLNPVHIDNDEDESFRSHLSTKTLPHTFYTRHRKQSQQSLTSSKGKHELPKGIIGGLIAFNNQSSTLMDYVSKVGDIMLMHETRIFYFTDTNKISTNMDHEETKSQEAKPVINHQNDPDNLKEMTDVIRVTLIGMFLYCTQLQIYTNIIYK